MVMKNFQKYLKRYSNLFKGIYKRFKACQNVDDKVIIEILKKAVRGCKQGKNNIIKGV